MKLHEADSPYEGAYEVDRDAPIEDLPSMRVVGYMSKKGRATVWDNKNGTFSVVVNSSLVLRFDNFDQAEDYAINAAFGSQFRMGT